MKIVYVEWLDAASARGWNGSKAANGLILIRSVGFLIEKTKHFMAISTSQNQQDNCLDPLSIPRNAIKKYKVLKTIGD